MSERGRGGREGGREGEETIHLFLQWTKMRLPFGAQQYPLLYK